MNKEFHNLFPQGSPNTVAGQYFSGASYLCPLSDMGVSVSNVTFEPSCRNNWHIHHNAVRAFFVRRVGVIIRSGANPLRN